MFFKNRNVKAKSGFDFFTARVEIGSADVFRFFFTRSDVFIFGQKLLFFELLLLRKDVMNLI